MCVQAEYPKPAVGRFGTGVRNYTPHKIPSMDVGRLITQVWEEISRNALEVITLLLALATTYLAWKTRDMAMATRAMAEETKASVQIAREQVAAAQDQVDVSEEQANAAIEALRLSIQPLLADVPMGTSTTGRQVVSFPHRAETERVDDGGKVLILDEAEAKFLYVSVPLRNIGNGVAVVTSGGYFREAAQSVVAFSQSLVPPGAIVRVNTSIPTDQEHYQPLIDMIRRQGVCAVEVGYRDIRGDRVMISTLHLYNGRVRQVSFRWQDEEQPFLMSGPADA